MFRKVETTLRLAVFGLGLVVWALSGLGVVS